jgi:hypothetical protein
MLKEARPHRILLLLASLPNGLLTIAINPPLGGQEETAHFTRASQENRPVGTASYREVFAGYLDQHPAALPGTAAPLFVPHEGRRG